MNGLSLCGYSPGHHGRLQSTLFRRADHLYNWFVFSSLLGFVRVLIVFLSIHLQLGPRFSASCCLLYMLHQAKVNGRCHWTRFGGGRFMFSFNIYCFFFWPFHIIFSLHWHGKPQRQPRVRRHDDEVRCWQSCVIQKVGWWWLSFCRNWFGYGWSTITGSKWFENNYCLQT